MTVRVLLVGNGGREHAIAEATVMSPTDVKLYAIMSYKNPGIAKLCDDYRIADLTNFVAMKEFIQRIRPNFAIIGPEAPLGAGIADFFEEYNIPTVGPKKSLARLETSKAFTRELMQKYNIEGLPRFRVFESSEGLTEYLEELGQVVVKPDGLTGGKGVKVQGDHFKTLNEAYDYAMEILSKKQKVVIEEKLEGEEFSLQSFVSGETVLDFPVVQDHKRAYEEDKGPNTGGMGSYSDANHLLPFLDENDVKQAHAITEKVAKAIMKECGEAYRGVMYGGFIKTANGVKLIEYNARFGDPEAMNVLPLIKSDFVEVCQALVSGKLDRVKMEFENKATVCKYAVPEGYPGKPVKGETIDLSLVGKDARVFYASVEDKPEGLVMLGSRAVAFVGIADTISEAESIAEFAVSRVKGPVFHRSDIGTRRLIERRVKHIRRLLQNNDGSKD
ncbi:phosphoribosylamine--glycine ligase [Candidatus Woesearchaeota archaeon]|nr:MAG: phosphoribosylamine--glycine ligase [Candidatus Woesearchaeota archaeon]